jgi:hypothetical protein
VDIKLEFEEIEDRIKLDSYQDKLDEVTQLWYNAIEELIQLRHDLLPKRAALIITAKDGVTVEINGKSKTVKPSNAEEREAVVEYILSDEVTREQNLQDKIKYYDAVSKNMRQLISSEQSKMSVDKTVAAALGAKQLG